MKRPGLPQAPWRHNPGIEGSGAKASSALPAVIRDVRDRFGASVLLVEQNAGRALTFAERGYLLQSGQMAASGPIETLRDDTLMRELYLGDGHGGRPVHEKTGDLQ